MPKIIFDSKSEIPEHLQAEAKEVDGKFELDAKGVLSKNKELLGTNKTLSENNQTLESQIESLKSQIPGSGKVVVDKQELSALQTENEAYKALGALDDIKPKVEGFDELKTETERARREQLLDKAFDFAGVVNKRAAFNLKQSDTLQIESETKDGKEIFYAVSTDDKGKTQKQVFDGEYLKNAEGFKDNLAALTSGEGKRFFRQAGSGGGGLSRAERIKAEVKEKEAARGNGAKSFVEAFSGTNPA